jgi:hypothetical protein
VAVRDQADVSHLQDQQGTTTTLDLHLMPTTHVHVGLHAVLQAAATKACSKAMCSHAGQAGQKGQHTMCRC